MELELGNTGLLLLLICSPMLGIFLLAVKKYSDEISARIAIGSSFLTFLISLAMFLKFDRNKSGFQMGQVLPWLPDIGLTFSLGVDGLSVWLILLTSFLTFLVLVSFSSITQKLRGYLINVLFLEIGMLGTFVSLDVLQFYVFWELMLIPMYFLIGIWGGKNRIYASLKFFIYTAFGSLLMLVAIAYLEYQFVNQFQDVSFYLSDLAKVRLTETEEYSLFLAFAFAFLIKVPVFPFHTWLPDAHVEAPTGGSVILAGVLLKMGIFGLVRFGINLFPVATIHFAPYLAVLGIIGIIFGALVAWVQTDIKKLVAYSSVSHMGFCLLGFSVLNPEGFQGALIQLLNHGVSTAALFFLVGVLYDRTHTREIADYGGIVSKVPMFCFVFMIFMLSSIGLPLTNGFIGEFLVLLGSFKGFYTLNGSTVHNLPLTIFCSLGAVLGVVLGALYMISLYRRVVFGKLNTEIHNLSDLSAREIFVFTPLLLLVFLIGLYPNFILRDLEGTTKDSLRIISVSTQKLEKEGDRRISPITKLDQKINSNQSGV